MYTIPSYIPIYVLDSLIHILFNSVRIFLPQNRPRKFYAVSVTPLFVFGQSSGQSLGLGMIECPR